LYAGHRGVFNGELSIVTMGPYRWPKNVKIFYMWHSYYITYLIINSL